MLFFGWLCSNVRVWWWKEREGDCRLVTDFCTIPFKTESNRTMNDLMTSNMGMRRFINNTHNIKAIRWIQLCVFFIRMNDRYPARRKFNGMNHKRFFIQQEHTFEWVGTWEFANCANLCGKWIIPTENINNNNNFIGKYKYRFLCAFANEWLTTKEWKAYWTWSHARRPCRSQ